MEGDAENAKKDTATQKKDVSSLLQVATHCIDDHLIPPEDYETTGELFAACAHMVQNACTWP